VANSGEAFGDDLTLGFEVNVSDNVTLSFDVTLGDSKRFTFVRWQQRDK
jgi:hypothetical protein